MRSILLIGSYELHWTLTYCSSTNIKDEEAFNLISVCLLPIVYDQVYICVQLSILGVACVLWKMIHLFETLTGFGILKVLVRGISPKLRWI
ncbi:hypothetical protein ACET3Z_001491 [Daucus carota]